jgi:hypothetical protein
MLKDKSSFLVAIGKSSSMQSYWGSMHQIYRDPKESYRNYVLLESGVGADFNFYMGCVPQRENRSVPI